MNFFSHTFLFLNLGGGEIAVIMFFILIFFGSKNIPNLAKGLGRGMREFKDAMNGIEREIKNAADEASQPVKKEIEKVKDQDLS